MLSSVCYCDSIFLCIPSFSCEWSAVEAAWGGIAGGDPGHLPIPAGNPGGGSG